MSGRRFLLRALGLALSAVAVSQSAAPALVAAENAVDTGVRSLSTPVGVGCGLDTPFPSSPAASSSSEPQLQFSQVISNSLAKFISVHFSTFRLPPGDYVRIRAADASGTDTRTLEFRGGTAVAGTYSAALTTTAVIVELFSRGSPAATNNEGGCLGFAIDSYNYLPVNAADTEEAVCGMDDMREAACYADDLRSRNASAVVRLLTHKASGSYFCTGWLVGSQGHVMTNHHCISTQDEASNTEFQFMAQGETCATDCGSAFACAGPPAYVSSTLVATSESLDYALVKLDASVASTYGFLRMRESGAELHEQIFIVQHPDGWGKRVAIKSEGQYGTVESLTASVCSPEEVAYSLDTRGGSSGSPVIAWNDSAVVALHHCGGCPNSAINTQKLVFDMRRLGVLPPDAVVVAEGTDAVAETLAPTPAATMVVEPTPTPTSTTMTPTAAPTATSEAPTPTPTPTTTSETQTPAPTVTPLTTTAAPAPTTTATPATVVVSKTVVDGTILSTATTSSVDYIDFDVSADAMVELDVLSMEAVTQNNSTAFTDVNGDCNAGYIDSHILLFRLNEDGSISASNLVATNDDAPSGTGGADGSLSASDSFLSVFLSKGSYRLAVGPSPLTTEQAIAKSTSVSTRVRVCDAAVSNYGSYRVTLSSAATITAQAPGTYIGSQCLESNTARPYSICPYHREADTSHMATIDGSIVRSDAAVSVDYIPFTVTAFGRVTVEVVSYESRNGSDYVDVNGFCGSAYIDPVAFLFRANANGLTERDLVNAGDDDDNFAWRDNRVSVSPRDPYLSLGLVPDDYVLVVGRYPLSLNEAIARASGQSVGELTPASCGTASATGHYRALLKSAQALSATAPGSFIGEQCPAHQGHALCTPISA